MAKAWLVITQTVWPCYSYVAANVKTPRDALTRAISEFERGWWVGELQDHLRHTHCVALPVLQRFS